MQSEVIPQTATRVDRPEAGLAVITVDDGKVNAFTPALLVQLDQLLGELAREGLAVVIAGRPGRFSAGFDLAVLGAGRSQASELVRAGVGVLLRVLTHPRPVVAACGGHAIGMGAFLLVAADYRVGAEGNFRIGLPEVASGIAISSMVFELCRPRLTATALNRTLRGETVSPAGALADGYLDELADLPGLLDVAVERASAMAANPPAGFEATKAALRGPVVESVRARMEADLA
ncbi:MAG TPA: crotonase/enoyl-CoA hydratase family protein [Streptosporangiaceae bacterium]|nr:crotonase/enoyl-CoA hydratase family protein [Streptosporangiaceae bacterium]